LPANSYYSTVSGNTIKALTGSLSPVTPAQVSISCTHNINGTPGGFICDVPILDYEVRNAWSDNAYFDPNLGVNVGKVVRGGSTTITVDMNAHQDWGSNPIQVVPQASLPSGWTITPSSQYWYPSSGSNWIVFTVTWASDANWGTGSANGSTNIDFFARYLDRTRGPKTVSFYDGGLSMMCDYVNENSTKKVCTVNSGDSTNLGYVVMAPGITTCTTTSVPAGFNHSTPWGGGGWAEHYEGFTSGAITQNMVYTTTCQTAGGPLTDSVTVNLSGPPSGGPGGFSVVLTPASQTIQQGAAISDYTVTITSVDGFAGTVSLSVPAGKCPVAAGNCSLTIPSVTLTGGQVHNTGRLRISNSSSISPATYDLQVDGVSGTKSASGTAQLVVQGSNGPTGFGGGNGTCGKVTLTWNSHASASGYYVYRNQTGNSPSVAERVKTINSGATTTWTDPDSGTLTPGIYFYWISWYNGTQESAKTPLGSASISATSCDANLSSSDKDIVQVNGVLNTTSDCATPGQTPTGATYKVGDEVKFSINICNTGGSDATSVTVVDTLTNMAQPTGGWQAKLDGVNINPTVTGSEPTQTLTFNVGTVAAGASKKLTFTAKITPPVNFTGTTARFQNTANINYVKNGGGQTAVKTVVTPLLIFTRSNNPSIIEVAP
jgi:fimbrial isopeptide formation D2 family protein